MWVLCENQNSETPSLRDSVINLNFQLEGQGHILLKMADYVWIHVKIISLPPTVCEIS